MPFTVAKASFSEIVDDACRRHTPTVVERHRGKEAVIVVDREDLASALAAEHRFGTQVFIDAGRFAVAIDDMGIHGTGRTLDEAIDDAVEALRGYAERYFAELDFYRHTPNRASHYLSLLRFRATPAERQRGLLLEENEREATALA